LALLGFANRSWVLASSVAAQFVYVAFLVGDVLRENEIFLQGACYFLVYIKHRARHVALENRNSYVSRTSIFSTIVSSIASETLMVDSGACSYLLRTWPIQFNRLLGAVSTRGVQLELGVGGVLARRRFDTNEGRRIRP